MTTTTISAAPIEGVEKRPARTPAAATSRRGWHRVALISTAAAWATLALVHPSGGTGTAYDGLRHHVPLWVGIHLAQLVLSLALAAGLWAAVRPLRTPAARIARGSIAVYLVFFAAMDSIVGIATGLAVHHANGTTGAERQGAIDTVEYLMFNPIAGNTGIIWAIASTALVGATVCSSMALRRAGAARTTWVPVLAGCLLVTHYGPAAAIGVVSLAVGLHQYLRRGLR